MSKKIVKDEFLKRFYRNFPEAKIELIEYTAISNKCKIKCLKCGKEYTQNRARDFLNKYNCCIEDITKIERLQKIYEDKEDWEFIRKVDKDNFIIKHNKCGNQFKRAIQTSLDNPFSCSYCQTIKSLNMLDIKEVQAQIDKKFFGNIKILDYNGQLKRNHYKCLKCGLIFTQKHICLLQSRGCPKCDKFKSNGEKFVYNFLKENNISFEEQFNIKELPLQKFDFAVYNDNKISYFIEVQGEQHFEEREIFRDGLEKIQERDNRKRQYCKEKKIPLYELIYKNGKIKNLDILPINSTTISAKESTL